TPVAVAECTHLNFPNNTIAAIDLNIVHEATRDNLRTAAAIVTFDHDGEDCWHYLVRVIGHFTDSKKDEILVKGPGEVQMTRDNCSLKMDFLAAVAVSQKT